MSFILFIVTLLSLLVVPTNAFSWSTRRHAPKMSSLLMCNVKKGNYCLNVTLYVSPDKREDFLKAIKVNFEGTTKKEPLNRLYNFGESTTEKNTFHFQEIFASKEGFEAHTQAPHFKIWEQFAQSNGAFTKPPKIDFFEQIIL